MTSKSISAYLMLSTMAMMNSGNAYKPVRTAHKHVPVPKIIPDGYKDWRYDSCWVKATTKKSAIKKMVAYLRKNEIIPNLADITNRIECL